jgi:hypothetical protein
MEPPPRGVRPSGRAEPLAGASPLRSVVRLGWVVGRRPALWPTAVRQIGVLAAPGWWRRAPFLPLPSPEYLRFRLQTAYGGDGDRPIEPDDLVSYLRWCRVTRHHIRRQRRSRPGHRGGAPFRHRQSRAGGVAAPVP